MHRPWELHFFPLISKILSFCPLFSYNSCFTFSTWYYFSNTFHYWHWWVRGKCITKERKANPKMRSAIIWGTWGIWRTRKGNSFELILFFVKAGTAFKIVLALDSWDNSFRLIHFLIQSFLHSRFIHYYVSSISRGTGHVMVINKGMPCLPSAAPRVPLWQDARMAQSSLILYTCLCNFAAPSPPILDFPVWLPLAIRISQAKSYTHGFSTIFDLKFLLKV